MGRQVTLVLYVMAMVAVIVGVDFAFFRNRFWERLAVNFGIVFSFLSSYLSAGRWRAAPVGRTLLSPSLSGCPAPALPTNCARTTRGAFSGSDRGGGD